MTHEPGIRLAEELLRVAPTGPDRRLTRVFYAGDGSSAAEAAIKMAYQSALQRGERRPLYVHVAEGYHGDTLGAVSVGGIDLFHHTYGPILLETRMVSSPGVRREGQAPAERAAEVVAELRALMAAEGHAVCAVVVEPLVQGAGGMLTHDQQFLVGVREVCDSNGVAMVADEVATGIGATGRWWAVEHAGVVPDLLVLGKRVTGGYLPLSAVLATEEIFASFLGTPASARTFFHGHTYTANPLACAAALANLELMHTRKTVAHAADVGERLGALLAPLASHPGVREIRRVGTMTGVEVHPRTERTGFDVCRRAREHGVWLRPLGDVVVIMPPLAIEEPEIETIVAALASGLDEVFG
jgi:adenosylmethionine-8-amino-7-oxononanoate aminotransferase